MVSAPPQAPIGLLATLGPTELRAAGEACRVDVDAEHPPTRTERIGADRQERLEALIRGAGPHLEPLVDVGTAPNGDLLLVLPRPAAALTDLLAVPGWPARGEVVTVLVPLCGVLTRLHGAGVAHGGVAAAAVVFDRNGAPMLAAPVSPVLRERAGARAFGDAVGDDLARYDALATAMLERCGVRAALPSAADPEAHVRALFALAEPVPVRLRPAPTQPPDPPEAVPARLTALRPAAATRPAAARVDALREAVRRVRPRVWALAGGSVAALLAAVVLLPAGTAGAAQHGPTSSPTAASAASAIRPRPVGRSLSPAAALRALVLARAACLARSDPRCLDVLESAGSPVSHDDAAAVRAGSEAIAVDPGRLRVVAESGGTVTGDAAGVLVLAVRTPDGWRLRDVAAPPSRAGPTR